MVFLWFSILILRPFARAPEQEIGYHGLLIRVERDQPARERVRKIRLPHAICKIRRPQQAAGGARPRKSFSRILEIFFSFMAPLAAQQPVHLPGAFLEIFFSFQKATLGSRLALNPPRRPELPLNPSWPLWRPSSMSFRHLPGAFLDIFFSFQKATLGSRLPLNAPRRPELPLNPSWRPWRPSSMSFGHLPGAFLEIFFSFQKATLGSRLPLNHPPAPCAAFKPFMAPLAAKQHVLSPPAGRFPGDFLLVSASNVRQ